MASTQPLALSPQPCSWPGVPGTGRRRGHHKDCRLLWRQREPALRHQSRTRSLHSPAPAYLRLGRLFRPPYPGQSLVMSCEILKDHARPLNTVARPRETPRDHFLLGREVMSAVSPCLFLSFWSSPDFPSLMSMKVHKCKRFPSEGRCRVVVFFFFSMCTY